MQLCIADMTSAVPSYESLWLTWRIQTLISEVSRVFCWLNIIPIKSPLFLSASMILIPSFIVRRSKDWGLGHQVISDLLNMFNDSENGTVRACCIKALVQILFIIQIKHSQMRRCMFEKSLDDSNPVVHRSVNDSWSSF